MVITMYCVHMIEISAVRYASFAKFVADKRYPRWYLLCVRKGQRSSSIFPGVADGSSWSGTF